MLRSDRNVPDCAPSFRFDLQNVSTFAPFRLGVKLLLEHCIRSLERKTVRWERSSQSLTVRYLWMLVSALICGLARKTSETLFAKLPNAIISVAFKLRTLPHHVIEILLRAFTLIFKIVNEVNSIKRSSQMEVVRSESANTTYEVSGKISVCKPWFVV